MGSLVAIEVCLLIKKIGAILESALVAFPITVWAAGFFLKILLRELELTRISKCVRPRLGKWLARKEKYGRPLT